MQPAGGPGYSYARQRPYEPSLTSPPAPSASTSASCSSGFVFPSEVAATPFHFDASASASSSPPPADFSQSSDPYAVDAAPYQTPSLAAVSPSPTSVFAPLFAPSPTTTFHPSAPPFVPSSSSSTLPPPLRSVSASPTRSKRTTTTTSSGPSSLDPGARSWTSTPAPVPTLDDFPALAPAPAAAPSTGSSTTKPPNPKPPQNVTTAAGPSDGEVDLSRLIDQLYGAAEQIKRVHETRDAWFDRADELRRALKVERDERVRDQRRWDVERARLEHERDESVVLLREHARAAAAARDGDGDGDGDHDKKGKSRAVDDSVPPSTSSSSSSSPPPPSSVPVASTSTSSEPAPVMTIDQREIEEYQRLLATVQARLAEVERDKVALDHRIAQMLQEQETLWPEQRAVLMQKAATDRRELEKSLEKALKRVEVLEKDRPAPVLRIGNGPPKFVASKPRASDAPAEPDPRLAQLEARIAEVEADLTEALSRAAMAEDALEAYQTRTDKLLEAQQTEIDAVTHQRDKAQDAVLLGERKIASIKKQAHELQEGHLAALRERKAHEDEQRNELLRLKDEFKDKQEELEREVQKSTRDLAASERKKLEAKHQSLRDADKKDADEKLAATKAILEQERRNHDMDIRTRLLKHGDQLGHLECQLRDQREQQRRELDGLTKKYMAEIAALEAKCDTFQQGYRMLQAEKDAITLGPSARTPASSKGSGRQLEVPRATLADRPEAERKVYAAHGTRIANSALAQLG
ncbi:hypothetical protein JCM11491_006315 [Sporobolomyces phaffii]